MATSWALAAFRPVTTFHFGATRLWRSRTMPPYFMLNGERFEAKIKLEVDDDCNITAWIGLEKVRGGPLFPKSHVAPTDPKEQVAEALQYALDALVQERPPDALAFCEDKLREYDQKFVR